MRNNYGNNTFYKYRQGELWLKGGPSIIENGVCIDDFHLVLKRMGMVVEKRAYRIC